MGKIIISENVSLDGVVQDPTGEEGFRPSSSSARRWAPRPCCWAGGPTSGSPHGGYPAAANGRTG